VAISSTNLSLVDELNWEVLSAPGASKPHSRQGLVNGFNRYFRSGPGRWRNTPGLRQGSAAQSDVDFEPLGPAGPATR
jgi:hypothetical protein